MAVLRPSPALWGVTSLAGDPDRLLSVMPVLGGVGSRVEGELPGSCWPGPKHKKWPNLSWFSCGRPWELPRGWGLPGPGIERHKAIRDRDK